MSSDNPEGAENQQERLIQFGWVLGFVDGEGCFSVGFVRQPDRTGRRGYRTGYQVFHEFAVAQGARSLETLEALREFFGVGQVLVNRRQDNHHEHLHRFVVRKRRDLLEQIIPFFEAFPLRSAKRDDFHRFPLCVRLIADGRHRTGGGLADLMEIAETMNRRKPRSELVRILRGHTPNVPDIGR